MRMDRLTRSDYPKRIICLEPASVMQAGRDSSEDIYAFRHVSLVSLTRRTDMVDGKQTDSKGVCQIGYYRFSQPVTAGSQAVLENYLDAMLSWRGDNWLLVRQGGYELAISGILRMLETGKLILATRERKRDRADEDNYFAQDSGVLAVFGDPPIIIDCTWYGIRRVKILCLSNYLGANIWDGYSEIHSITDKSTRVSLSAKQSIEQTERSVERLGETFAWLLRSNEILGSKRMGYTAGGCAVNLYRSQYLQGNPESHQVRVIREIERESFRGGETRVFRAGQYQGTYWLTDVNSLYPFIMAAEELPSQLCEWVDDNTWRRASVIGNPSRAIAEVWIDTDKHEYQLRRNGKTIYAIGSFMTTLCGPELQEAYNRGEVVAVRNYSVYTKGNLFAAYVVDLYRERREAIESGNDSLATACKMLLNSLFGKFGQRASTMQPLPDILAPVNWGVDIMYDALTKQTRKRWYIGGKCFEESDKQEIRDSMVHISSWIVSAGRLYMERVRELIGFKNVYYQGLDSLLVTDDGLERMHSLGLIHQTELGKFKVKSMAKNIDIMGANNYRVDGKNVVQGLSGGCEIIDAERFLVNKVERLSSMIQRLESENVHTKRMLYTLKPTIQSGTVMPDGWIVPSEIVEPKPFNRLALS